MVSYGWTIDYINDSVTIPQILVLIEEIKNNPPMQVTTFKQGQKHRENKLLEQLEGLGDKVKVDKWSSKTIKSVIRLKDKVKLK